MCLKFGLKTHGIPDLFQVPLLGLPKLIYYKVLLPDNVIHLDRRFADQRDLSNTSLLKVDHC